MFIPKRSFSSFSVDDQDKARAFYTNVLGLQVNDNEVGLELVLSGGSHVFVYPKENHQPATFTVLNFEVDDIDTAVDDLMQRGVTFERYPQFPGQDEKGIARGDLGPPIAWFEDPAGNILAVIES
jgi:catechol 2,3-dioxygenase-like lactoylglutathione lyase family enzyme